MSRTSNSGFDFERAILPISLVVLAAAFALATPSTADPINIANILKVSSISFVMFLGATWIFAAGEIDVSFINVAALANVVAAWAVASGEGWPLAIALAMAAGLGFGLLNGVLVGYFRLPSIVVTIATSGLALSIAGAISGGASFGIGDTGLLGSLVDARLGFVPVVFVVSVVLCVLFTIIQERFTIGRYIYAQSVNYQALFQSGVNVRLLNLVLFVFSATCAALAGCLITADLASGQPALGGSYLIDGMTAIFLGSMVFRRGEPNVVGTLVGAIFLALLTSGASLSGWANYQADIVKGAVLLIALSFALFFRRRREAAGSV